jgi:hypothetical protein
VAEAGHLSVGVDEGVLKLQGLQGLQGGEAGH